MKTGLVSIAFRKLMPEEIIKHVAACGLDGIEWGGDIHVPLGDIARARQVGTWTREAGLAAACYGSYVRMTDEETADGALEKAVETAQALGAPLIRIWAGKLPSVQADAAARQMVADNARRLAALAAQAHLEVAFEYHGNTLTDETQSAAALLSAVACENVGCLWQPPAGMPVNACLDSIRAVGPFIRNIHVFSWTERNRTPLSHGAAKWREYMGAIGALSGERSLLLEFVRDDSVEQFYEDAACLRRWRDGVWEGFAAD